MSVSALRPPPFRPVPAEAGSMPAEAPAALPLSPAARGRAERIRRWGAAARRAGPGDLDRACALIGAPSEALTEAHGAVLLAAMAQGCTRPLALHRRGAATASGDERWLMTLLERLAEGDEASARFLTGRRIAPMARRRVLHLARRLAALLTEPAAP